MNDHDLTYRTVVPAGFSFSESLFAEARHQIEQRYGVSPTEVFVDRIEVTGLVQAGDIVLDLDLLHVRIVTFGASSAGAAQLASTILDTQAVDTVKPSTGLTAVDPTISAA